MTYCLAVKINDGLVFASDSRTNAGLDNISTYSKMFTFNVGDRAFVILTSGNLSTSQAVYHRIEKDLESKKYSPGVHCPKCFGTHTQKQVKRFKDRQRQMELSILRGEKHLGGIIKQDG